MIFFVNYVTELLPRTIILIKLLVPICKIFLTKVIVIFHFVELFMVNLGA